jgi:hypothetical protein
MSSAHVSHQGRTVSIAVDNRTVWFDEDHSPWVKVALGDFLARRGLTRRENWAKGEILVSKGGGTDWVPTVWLSSAADDGTSQGSVWLDESQARAVLDVL